MNNLFMKKVPQDVELALRLSLDGKAFDYFFDETKDADIIIGYFPIKTPDEYYRMECNGKFYGVIVHSLLDSNIKIFFGQGGKTITNKELEILRNGSIDNIKENLRSELTDRLDLC